MEIAPDLDCMVVGESDIHIIIVKAMIISCDGAFE